MKTLLIIDVQNDYFPQGKFPLWNSDGVLRNIEHAINMAKDTAIPIIHIQHIADPAMGISPFFNQGTEGASIHPDILKAAPEAPVVVKNHADSFFRTNLEDILKKLGTTELIICGMMTQNCVTHTAISRTAENYSVSVMPECCTTVSEMLHNIALHALSTRVKILPKEEAMQGK